MNKVKYEKELFNTLLDLYYAKGTNTDLISDITHDLKHAKKRQRRIERGLAKGAAEFKVITGREFKPT